MSTQPQQEQALIVAGRTSPVIVELAERWKMTPQSMIDTLKATVFPQKDRNDRPIVVSNAQLLMFLQVCQEYSLNPYIKEIYAFPTKGGGIVPMVPVDGWANIINRSPQMDGLEFVDEWELDQSGARKGRVPFSTTCIIYRKDRSRPIKVTEYFHECVQPNKDPWTKWPSRMLRHKAMIQCARIAFSLGGIYDPDEAERIAESTDKVEPAKPGRASAQVIEGSATQSTAAQTVTGVQGTASSQAPAAAKSEAQPPSRPQKGEAPLPQQGQTGASPDTSGCICNCCKRGSCDCPAKEEMEQCGCSPCMTAVKTPEPSSSPSLSDIFNDNEPAAATEAIQGEVLSAEKPPGPYVPQEKLRRLFVHAASANINVVKGSHDDELHKVLKAKWNIDSIKEIPISLFETVLEEIAPNLKAARAGKPK